MNPELGPEDVGKSVCTAEGVPIGQIAEVTDGEAYIRAKAGLLEGYGSLLTSCWRSDRTFHLKCGVLEKTGDGEVRLDVSGRDLTPEISP